MNTCRWLLLVIVMLGGVPVYATIHLDVFVNPEISSDADRNIRGSLWWGLGFGGDNEVVLQALLFHTGYSRLNDKTYVPVVSIIPLASYGLWKALPDSSAQRWNALIFPTLILAPISGLRVNVGDSYLYGFVGHRLEIYAPHPGVSETVELGLAIACFEGMLFQRFSTVSGLQNRGAALGLTWQFEVD